MINLHEMLNHKNAQQKQQQDGPQPQGSRRSAGGSGGGLIRDKLLLKEVQEMEDNLPSSAQVHFPEPSILYRFHLTIRPTEGFWLSGQFRFLVEVPEAYNNAPPVVRCLTRLWHPNIDEDGRVCLSMLRQTSLDAAGWAPTRRLKDMVWGIDSLFGDLCDFNDALNTAAAEQYNSDKEAFKLRVQRYIAEYSGSSRR